jgi:hypothetical protein
MTESEFADRLERLEQDNRRLKRLVTVALVMAAALGAIYAARPVPQKIEAHEFDVTDNAGKVRVRIGVDYWKSSNGQPYDAPALALYDAQGGDVIQETATCEAQGCLPSMTMFDKHQVPVITIRPSSVEETKARLYVGNRQLIFSSDYNDIAQLLRLAKATNDRIAVARAALIVAPFTPGIEISNDKAPFIQILGSKGFSMDLGSIGTVNKKTGATQQTSAASIVMFGNDKDQHVIWQAP